MTQSLPITAIILCHRADKRFRACLAAVQGMAEILVVDDQSQNEWSQLHHDFTFQLFSLAELSVTTPITDFSQVRNQALAHATQEWVFMIDSDEVLTAESLPELCQLVTRSNRGLADSSVSNNAVAATAGVWVKRIDIFHGQQLKWGEAGQVKQLRLFKKSQTHFERPVHEMAVVNGPVQSSEITLLHYAHPSLSQFWDSIVKYAQLEAEYRHKKNQFFTVWRLLFFPLGKFGYTFFLKLGFLDGWRGLSYSFWMSLHSLLVSSFLYEKIHQPS